MGSKITSLLVRVFVVEAIGFGAATGVLLAQSTTLWSMDPSGVPSKHSSRIGFPAPVQAHVELPESEALPVAIAARGARAVNEAAPSSVLHRFGALPLAFIENRGQFDERVCFAARQGGVRAYFTRDAFVLQLVARAAPRPSPGDVRRAEEAPAEPDRCGDSIFLTFEGASREVVVEGIDALPPSARARPAATWSLCSAPVGRGRR